MQEDIDRYRGRFRMGWDERRRNRLNRQIELGIVPAKFTMSDRDPAAQPWAELSEEWQDQWDLRMAIHAAMIHRVDVGIGKVLDQLQSMGAWEDRGYA